MTMKRTISGMIGAGSLAHNRRDFIAENVDSDRVHLNICYQNENLKQVYRELFDESVERYNVGKLERAVTYRDKKIKPLFIKMKNKIAAMAAQVKELTGQVETWKRKYQKEKQKCEGMKIELQELRRDNNCLSEKNEKLLNISTQFDRVVRVLGTTTVDAAVQKDIQIQQELEEKLQKEQMPRKMSDRLQWARERSQEHNTQSRKSKTKYRGMEI